MKDKILKLQQKLYELSEDLQNETIIANVSIDVGIDRDGEVYCSIHGDNRDPSL